MEENYVQRLEHIREAVNRGIGAFESALLVSRSGVNCQFDQGVLQDVVALLPKCHEADVTTRYFLSAIALNGLSKPLQAAFDTVIPELSVLTVDVGICVSGLSRAFRKR